jgi:hypothetical protein
MFKFIRIVTFVYLFWTDYCNSQLFPGYGAAFQKIGRLDAVTERYYSDVVVDAKILEELRHLENMTWKEQCPKIDFTYSNSSLNPLDVRICISMKPYFHEANEYSAYGNKKVKDKVDSIMVMLPKIHENVRTKRAILAALGAAIPLLGLGFKAFSAYMAYHNLPSCYGNVSPWNVFLSVNYRSNFNF